MTGGSAKRRILPAVLLLLLFIPVSGKSPPDAAEVPPFPSLLMIADFDRMPRNRAGGFHSVSGREPSRVSAGRVSDVFRGGGGKSLRIDAFREGDGFAAAWISFHDLRKPEKKYLDVRGVPYLSFWVRGERGAEAFRIKVADDAWAKREDGLVAGPVTKFLPGGVTKAWREVLIPLASFPSLRLESMAFLTFDFDDPGRHTIYIDDIAFKADPETPTPAAPKAAESASTDRPRAMWVWDPLPLLLEPGRSADFFRFLRRERIGRVWMQVPARILRAGGEVIRGIPSPGEEFRVEILHPAKLRAFLRGAHRAGIRVDALDGAPEYAAKEYHAVPVAVVDAVASFNRSSPPGERFDGVHFDNEPYLLVGWHVPEVRERILADFLELLLECRRRIRSRGEMELGIDIPFWWQYPDPETGESIGEVTFRGVRKAASFHAIDIADSVGVMNYRNTADGADGMLAHGTDLLEYAEKARNARLFMGVETIAEPPAVVRFAAGLPREDFGKALALRAPGLLSASRIDGFRMHVLDDGAHLHLGIEIPGDAPPGRIEAASGAITRIALLLDVPDAKGASPGKGDILRAAIRNLSEDPEWRDPRPRGIPGPSGSGEFAGFEAKRIFLPKITFGNGPISRMRRELAFAEEEFGAFGSFAGIAVHHYGSYRKMVEPSPR